MNKFEYKAIRVSTGKSQVDMAKALGVSIDTIRRREQGKSPITTEMMLSATAIKLLADKMSIWYTKPYNPWGRIMSTTLNTALDATNSNRKTVVIRSNEVGSNTEYYATGGVEFPGKARWTVCATADNDATKAAAIKANLAL